MTPVKSIIKKTYSEILLLKLKLTKRIDNKKNLLLLAYQEVGLVC